jgi:hypothetical protein
MHISDILAIVSAAFFVIGSLLLADAIEFHADKITLTDDAADQAVKKMGSHGWINSVKLRWGKIMNGLGLVIFVLSVACKAC